MLNGEEEDQFVGIGFKRITNRKRPEGEPTAQDRLRSAVFRIVTIAKHRKALALQHCELVQ